MRRALPLYSPPIPAGAVPAAAAATSSEQLFTQTGMGASASASAAIDVDIESVSESDSQLDTEDQGQETTDDQDGAGQAPSAGAQMTAAPAGMYGYGLMHVAFPLGQPQLAQPSYYTSTAPAFNASASGVPFEQKYDFGSGGVSYTSTSQAGAGPAGYRQTVMTTTTTEDEEDSQADFRTGGTGDQAAQGARFTSYLPAVGSAGTASKAQAHSNTGLYFSNSAAVSSGSLQQQQPPAGTISLPASRPSAQQLVVRSASNQAQTQLQSQNADRRSTVQQGRQDYSVGATKSTSSSSVQTSQVQRTTVTINVREQQGYRSVLSGASTATRVGLASGSAGTAGARPPVASSSSNLAIQEPPPRPPARLGFRREAGAEREV